MRREAIHRLISELDASDELKEVLRGLIDFADEEDEALIRDLRTGKIKLPYKEE